MTTLQPGRAWPLGAHVQDGGVNLAVWAPDASAVDWCLFDRSGRTETARWRLPVCTDGVWHGFAPGLKAPCIYGLRAEGPWAPEAGHRFNPAKLLLDPYATEVVGAYAGDLSLYRGDSDADPRLRDGTDNAAVALKARLCPAPKTVPGRPPRPQVPWSRTVLYEVHVKGATRLHPSVPARLRGTYAGLGDAAFIAHLQQLGVTTLNLLPVQARADEARLQAMGLGNYWGYSPIAFLAPEPRYWSGRRGTTPGSEFRAMVDALHAAGLEVVLDVVFNHTAETDELGPTLSYRGLANARYYRLEREGGTRYVNWTGCGNTLDLAEPRVVQLVMDALRHWVVEMGVDGFRFDLACTLGRGADGAFSRASGFFAAVQSDPVLAGVKMIAEPWDLGPGGYQLGAFPPGWAEWNDRFRDSMRSFWLRGGVDRGEFVHRFAGSSTEFRHGGRAPSASINFVTAHDGFTLRDLLSHDHKHNEANGEHNRDGHHHNASWNCGVEGPTDDAQVNQLRHDLARALLACLLLAQGTPMLLAGDEIGHSQGGNNNAYCQDNDTTWLDWRHADADLVAAMARLLALRREQPALHLAHWLNGNGDVHWLGADGELLEGEQWQDATVRTLAVVLGASHAPTPDAPSRVRTALLLVNAEAHEQWFRLPPGHWEAVYSSHAPGGAPAPEPQPWHGRRLVPRRSVQLALAARCGPTCDDAPTAAT